jgi:tellurite resistance protein
VAPLAGVRHAPIGLSWFFFGVGIVYWLTLAPMVLHRMVTEPLPPQLKPTQSILIAPPAVAGLAWVSLGHGWADPVSRVQLAVAILHGLLLAGQARELARPAFAVGVWAYTFPLAALASALLAAQDGTSWIARLTAAIVLAVVSTVALGVAVRTVVAVLRHEICRPAGPATPAAA